MELSSDSQPGVHVLEGPSDDCRGGPSAVLYLIGERCLSPPVGPPLWANADTATGLSATFVSATVRTQIALLCSVLGKSAGGEVVSDSASS